MSDASAIQKELAALSAELAAQPSGGVDVESRLRRIEDAIAVMQDQQSAEERLLERLLNRVTPTNGRGRPPIEVVSTAQPVASSALPGIESLLPPTSTGQVIKAAVQAHRATSGWLLVDIFREISDMVRMFFDNRFRVSRNARLAPMLAAIAVILSYMYFHFLFAPPLFNIVFDKTFDFVVLLFTYKYLGREAARYREEMSKYP